MPLLIAFCRHRWVCFLSLLSWQLLLCQRTWIIRVFLWQRLRHAEWTVCWWGTHPCPSPWQSHLLVCNSGFQMLMNVWTTALSVGTWNVSTLTEATSVTATQGSWRMTWACAQVRCTYVLTSLDQVCREVILSNNVGLMHTMYLTTVMSPHLFNLIACTLPLSCGDLLYAVPWWGVCGRREWRKHLRLSCWTVLWWIGCILHE